MTSISGNTYAVRDQIKTLGGKWDPARKVWMVPDDMADRARALVGQPRLATAEGAIAATRLSRCEARTPTASPDRPASPKQLDYLRKLLTQAERITRLDSFPGTGRYFADLVRAKVKAAGGSAHLTAEQASEMIEDLIAIVDDEM